MPESDEETEGPGSNKRGLSDSYLALKEASPSVPQMKRHSAEYLPRVPGCLDSSYYESMPLIGTLSIQSCATSVWPTPYLKEYFTGWRESRMDKF